MIYYHEVMRHKPITLLLTHGNTFLKMVKMNPQARFIHLLQINWFISAVGNDCKQCAHGKRVLL